MNSIATILSPFLVGAAFLPRLRNRAATGRGRNAAPTVALVALLAACLLPATGRAEVTPEYKLKAAYLFNFARFSQWPPAVFAATDSPLVIGVLGANPFESELEKLVAGRPVGGRPVIVKQIANAEEAKTCQIVFIPASERANLAGYLAAFRNLPVLTVGESEDFLDAGGVIRFFIAEKKIRFDINKSQADAGGVRLDSQLLSLAAAVREAAGKKDS